MNTLISAITCYFCVARKLRAKVLKIFDIGKFWGRNVSKIYILRAIRPVIISKMNRVNTCFFHFRCKSTALECKDVAPKTEKWFSSNIIATSPCKAADRLCHRLVCIVFYSGQYFFPQTPIAHPAHCPMPHVARSYCLT